MDASLAIKWLAHEPGSEKAVTWLKDHAGDEILAPIFLPIEVASVLRQKVCRTEMTSEEGLQALKLLERLQIRFIWDWSLLERAFSLAAELDQPTVYDTAYLALAEKCGCDLWTADARFARVAARKYPQVRLLYGFEPRPS
ncbi:MAG: type II toxin-antitoxin system VapC family toxin [Firmicutes bacterium]|nr:type II toxin-antitoxin system VapC family toxin [Bacillota bacterium]